MGDYVTNLQNEAAFATTYGRAVRILQEGKIISLEEEHDIGGFIELRGNVRGSSGETYSTTVDLLDKEQEVFSYSCTCVASREYYGMCKHEIALVLSFLNRRGDVNLPEVRSSKPAPKGTKQLKVEKPVETSFEISNFLVSHMYNAQDAQGRDAFVPEDRAEAPVELTCIISEGIDTRHRYYYNCGYGYWSVGLKITRGKVHYIVKSISELVDAWRGAAFYSYGKNLEFVHRRSAFSDQANALLDILAPVVESQQSMYGAIQEKYSYDQINYSSKSIPMTEDALVRILDLLVGSKMILETDANRYYYDTKKVKHTVTVVEGDPELNATIVEDGDGYKLSLYPNEIRCVGGEGMLFILAENCVAKTSARFAADMGLLCRKLLPARDAFAISAADMPGFCAVALPALRAHTELVAPEGLGEMMPPAPEFTFRIGIEDDRIVCHGVVEYGEDRLDIYEPAKKGQPTRDVAAEVRAQQTVECFFPFGDHEPPNYRDGIIDDPYMYSSWYVRQAQAAQRAPEAPYFPKDDDELYYFLFADGLRELAEIGTVLLSDRLRSVVVRPSPSVTVQAGVHNGLLDIEVRADDMAPAELIAYLASYERKQRYMRLSNGDIVRLDGSVKALAELSGGLGVETEDLVEGAKGLPLNRTLFVDAMLKRAGGVQFERNRAFKAIIREFDTIADLDISAPESLRGILRTYQDEGFKWLYTLGKVGFGGVLADDMGLGKTLQMIAYLLARKEAGERRGVSAGVQQTADAAAGAGAGSGVQGAGAGSGVQQAADTAAGVQRDAGVQQAADVAADVQQDSQDRQGQRPAIVVCPASLVYNWTAEIERFAPQLAACAVTGSKSVRARIIEDADAGGCDVLVTSYDLMKRDIDAYDGVTFSTVVLDEAQYIKNSATQSAKAAKRLQADQHFALTGTPIENRLGELWSIFDFLMPGVLGSEKSFDARFSQAIANKDESASRQLQSLVGPFILRRLKQDVLADLPDKNESVVFSNMDGEQGKLYRASEARIAHLLSDQRPEEFAGMKLQILAELTKLRQLCCDPHLLYEDYKGDSAKLETCVELVRNASEAGHGILLFSQFTSMLSIIGERLQKEKIAYLELTGATSKEERVRLVERFQAGEAPVFLISLKAGGVGLNLTAADIVIHYDPWWNLAAQNQATDRAHRIGQTKEVSVFKLIAKDTIEERIVDMQERKRDLADAVLGGESIGATSISREDLLALLNA